MIILKYELKRHRKYILGWAIALALCVFVMTPTYYSFMDVSTGDLYETLGTSDFYKGVGVSMEYLTSPLGIYAFLTSFFMIASGIFGMHFGSAIHTTPYPKNDLLGKGVHGFFRRSGREHGISSRLFFGAGPVSLRY